MQQLDEVSRHFAHIISGVKAAGKNIFDVKPEAEAKYIELMWKMSPPATGRPSGCTPGYCKLRCPRTSAQLSFLCSGPHSLLLLPLEFALTRKRWGADNNEGILPEKGTHVLMGQFPGGPPGYFAHMQKCRDEARCQFRLVEAFSPPSWSLTRLCLLDRERRWTRLISSDRACWRVLSKLMKRWQYTESLV